MQARLRLRRPADFARLREHGKALRHPLLVLSVADNNLGYNRYGLIASRRLGKAVKRNRVRRLLREVLRQNHARIHPGHDIVLIAREAIVGQRFAVINQAVQHLLGRAQLLSAPDEQIIADER